MQMCSARRRGGTSTKVQNNKKPKKKIQKLT